MLPAIVRADLPIIRAYFGHCAIAPTMTNVAQFVARRLEYLVLLGGDVHLFCPKIFAEIWVHGVVDV